MELLEAGASPDAIRAAVDSKFAGQGTDTPHPNDHAPEAFSFNANAAFQD